MHVVPVEQSLFSLQGGEGARTQATVAVGFGTNPALHEHTALWFETVQIAFGPQVDSRQGFMHLLSLHDSLALQSSSEWQPITHILWRQICPRKQSLSTRHVNIQFSFKHFSFNAQSLSAMQLCLQILSRHELFPIQSSRTLQDVGILTHSMSSFPVKPGGHEQCLMWSTVLH